MEKAGGGVYVPVVMSTFVRARAAQDTAVSCRRELLRRAGVTGSYRSKRCILKGEHALWCVRRQMEHRRSRAIHSMMAVRHQAVASRGIGGLRTRLRSITPHLSAKMGRMGRDGGEEDECV